MTVHSGLEILRTEMYMISTDIAQIITIAKNKSVVPSPTIILCEVVCGEKEN